MTQLKFSIDLEAEIQKITRKQHLNRVHFLIQLVRHALTHQPGCVGVWSKSGNLQLSQDGDPFNPDEWQLLKSLTLHHSDGELQSALTQLEARHGVAILSLLMNFPYVRIETPGEVLQAEQGAVHFQARETPQTMRGYRIFIERSGAQPDEERRELCFYASGSSVPIFFNDHQINTPIQFTDQILMTRFENHEGSGAVGVPNDDELCSITYYKNGVRLGMKRFMPPNGLVYHGYWDSNISTFESDYRKSIQNGDQCLQHFSRVLYQEIPKHFSEFNAERKTRIKKLLFGLSQQQWLEQFGHIPLFHSGSRPFALSLKDLALLDLYYQGVPFQTQKTGTESARFPVLHPEDVFFLSRRSLRLKQLRAVPGKRAEPGPARETVSHLQEEDLTPDQSRFLRDLNRLSPFCIFYFTNQRTSARMDEKGIRQVYLKADEPQTRHALQQYRKRPETLSLLKYQLLGCL